MNEEQVERLLNAVESIAHSLSAIELQLEESAELFEKLTFVTNERTETRVLLVSDVNL
jgi:hypothetical protein